MSDSTVTYERKGRVAYIILDRPEKRNAITFEMEAELDERLAQFDFDEDAWVAIISSSGTDFSVGADIHQRFDPSGREARDHLLSVGAPGEGHLGRTSNWKPVIGAIDGWCVGLAIGLALECDLLVATTEAQFMVAEVKLGVAGWPLWAKLQTFMPSKIATEMMLLGNAMPAAELYRLGLINRLVARADLMSTAEHLAAELCALPPLAVRANVRVSRWPWKALTDEVGLFGQSLKLHLSEDFDESVLAFTEKRKPRFGAR